MHRLWDTLLRCPGFVWSLSDDPRLSPVRDFPITEKRNGKTLIACITLGWTVLVFVIGWWGGQQARWMAAGEDRRRLAELEEWRKTVETFHSDQILYSAQLAGTNGATSKSISTLEADVKELQTRVNSLSWTTARCCPSTR